MYSLIFAIFIFCLAIATPISTAIYNGECKVSKIADDLTIYEKDQINFEIDNLRIPNDDYQTIVLLGKACATAPIADNREVFLILQSAKNTYKINARVTAEAPGSFNSAQPEDTKTTRGSFLAVFSALGIQNGSYEMYIVVKEDANSYGIVYSDKHFIKSNRELREGW